MMAKRLVGERGRHGVNMGDAGLGEFLGSKTWWLVIPIICNEHLQHCKTAICLKLKLVSQLRNS